MLACQPRAENHQDWQPDCREMYNFYHVFKDTENSYGLSWHFLRVLGFQLLCQ